MHLGFDSIRASDGVALMHFYDGSQAKSHFDGVIGRATNILERGEKKDREGKVIGERAVVSLPSTNDPNKEYWAVVWTEGSAFEELTSISLCHALELERRFTYGWRSGSKKREK